MIKTRLLMLGFLVCFISFANAQRIIYSETDKDDSKNVDFEIIGKIGNNFQIYKAARNKSYVVLYDQDMKQIDKVEQDYIPDERLINSDVYAYSDFSYLFYQYQKRNVVYFMAAKIDENGKKVGEPIELDTTHLGFAANNKIYNSITSEDKNKFLIFKVNSRNRSKYLITTILLNDKLESIKKSQIYLPMDERNDFIDEFKVDNKGNIVFVKFTRNNNDNISAASLILKGAQDDDFTYQSLNLNKLYLDQVFLKIDNFNNRYFLTSFTYQQRRGNIEGLYFYIWDKDNPRAGITKTIKFGDELRNEARGNNGSRFAFDNYFIRNIIIKKSGGFLLNAESYYTTSRGNNFNRWDYLYGIPSISSFDNYYYSPYSYGYNSMFWRSRSNQQVRYHADNIVVLSFDNKGDLEWNNVIKKEQFNDDSDDLVSFQLVNTGAALHFIFNSMEKRAVLLTDFVLDPNGSISRNPSLKNIDRGYSFMPKYAKQINSQQVLIPCMYRNYICFAKVDF